MITGVHQTCGGLLPRVKEENSSMVSLYGLGSIYLAHIEKLALAIEAIKVLPPLVRASGVFSPATAIEPAHWVVNTGPWAINLTEHVLHGPADAVLSMVLDVWGPPGGKVLSVSWMPDRPWAPPCVVCCKRGPWQELLGGDAMPKCESKSG